jgi:hypothetical protein
MEMRVSVSVRLGLDYTRLWETLCCWFITVTILHTHGLGGEYALILLFRNVFCLPGGFVAELVLVKAPAQRYRNKLQ